MARPRQIQCRSGTVLAVEQTWKSIAVPAHIGSPRRQVVDEEVLGSSDLA